VDPEWITGLCDRSANFSIIVYSRKEGKWEIRPVFELLIHIRYKEVVDKMNKYFKIGSVYKVGNKLTYRVNKFSDLNEVIVPHFKKYPLISTKIVAFKLWLKILELMNKDLHKSERGLMEILSLYASIGRGPSKKVMKHFPSLKPAIKPEYSFSSIQLSEYWISGYLSIYCNFQVNTDPHGFKESYYNRVVPSFNFSRKKEELILMELLSSYFSVTPNIRSNGLRIDVNVYSLDKLRTVVDLFTSFPLSTPKQKEFNVWSEIANKLIFISSIPSHRISLDYYMPLFLNLVKELNVIRNLNNK